jgi:hypothetical protein
MLRGTVAGVVWGSLLEVVRLENVEGYTCLVAVVVLEGRLGIVAGVVRGCLLGVIRLEKSRVTHVLEMADVVVLDMLQGSFGNCC